MIAAILRAQLLSMRFGARRGAVFGSITAVCWYGFWAVVGGIAWIIAAGADANALRTYLPVAFLAVFAYWQLVPLISASMGSGLDMRKLLVFPVPHRKLFLVEILLRFVSGAEMVLVIAGGSVGLLKNPLLGWRALPDVAAAAIAFITFNVLLASGVRSLLERLLTRRKVREVFSFLLLMIYVVPRLLVETGRIPRNLGTLRSWTSPVELPWAAAAIAVLGHSIAPALLSLVIWTVVALLFGRAQFERSLRYDIVAAQATPVGGDSRWQVWKDRFYRLPAMLLRDPLAAIIEKELRSLARTPRFRMLFLMGFTFGMMLWFPIIMGHHGGSGSGPSRYFLVVVSVYSLTLLGQVSYWNCFGFDRSATAFYFAAPQRISLIFAGKNIAALVFIYLEVLVIIGVSAAFRLVAGASIVLETLIVTAILALYLMALGNISSVHYPRGWSPDRPSHGGASGRFQGMILVFYPIALLPVFLAYLARYAFDSEIAFTIVLAIAAVIGVVLYWIAMDSAVAAAHKRREQILQELSKGEGPIIAE